MSARVQINVQAEQTVRFPGVCVNCARPAGDSLPLAHKSGQAVREIDVPLCERCAAVVQRQSGVEERLVKIRRLVAGVTGAALAVLLLLLIPGDMVIWIRLLLALLVGGIAAGLAYALFKPAITRAATAEKRAVLDAAQLESFSWRTATFVFENESFAERFKLLNESLIIES